MPILGETKDGRNIGYKTRHRCIWHACSDCGKQRWVRLVKGKPQSPLCQTCAAKLYKLAGSKNCHWRGGKHKSLAGYIMIYVAHDDFFYPMTCGGVYVKEHRLVMARHLGRCLHSWEIVHHKNGIKDDNRIENLQLVTDDRHKQITIMENRIGVLEQRVTLLEAENTLLRKEECLR